MKKILKKHWPLMVIGVLLLVVGIYMSDDTKRQVVKQLVQGAPAFEEGLSLKNVHYTQKDPDKGITWLLDAREAAFSQDRQIMSFKDFHLKVESKDRPTIEIEGKRGDYDKNSQIITLHGDLQGTMDDGYKVLTERAVYKGKEGYLTSDAPVTIYGPLFSIKGTGLFFNPKQETLRIDSHVITSIHEEELLL